MINTDLTKYGIPEIPENELEILMIHQNLKTQGAFYELKFDIENNNIQCDLITISFESIYNDSTYDIDNLVIELFNNNVSIKKYNLYSGNLELFKTDDNSFLTYLITPNML